MPKSQKKKQSPKRVLALPDLEQSKTAVLNSQGLPRCQYQTGLTATRIMPVPVRKNSGDISELLIYELSSEIYFRTRGGADKPRLPSGLRLGAGNGLSLTV